jgi:hypothetical protein
MLVGAGAVASAAPAPAVAVKTLSGVGPGGIVYHDYQHLVSATAASYSYDRNQWFEVARTAQWSNQANSVYVDVQPKSFEYHNGLWWVSNTSYKTLVHTRATLIKIGEGGGEIAWLSNYDLVTANRGGNVTGNLSFGKHGKGTYCIRLESQISGMYWERASSDVSNSRSFCFER